MKLTSERLWWLKKFSDGGWTVGHGMMASVKKWRAHSAALVKMGYLERSEYGDDSLFFRITDAGREALKVSP